MNLALMLLLLGAPDEVAFAIAIGVNEPPADESLQPLRFADDDAVRFHRFFSRITERSVLLTVMDHDTQQAYPGLSSRALPPTKNNVERAIAELAAAATEQNRRTVIYLSYSGHGAVGEDAEAFLTLLDGQIARRDLAGYIESLQADYVHLIVDACHAAEVVGVRGDPFAKESSAVAQKITKEEAFDLHAVSLTERHPGLGLLIATSADQEAHEWTRFRAGVFTHEVLSSLSGPADVNGDRRIEYSEVHAFVAAANRQIRTPRAAPRVVAVAPRRNQNVAVVDLRRMRDSVLIEGAPPKIGRFFVELASGERYLDAHLWDVPSAVLALPRGGGAFLRTASKEAALPARSTTFDQIELVERKQTAKGSLDQAMLRALFASPFGVTYYKGFVDRTGAVGVQFTNELVTLVDDDTSVRQPLAIASLSLSGASFVAFLITGALALDARSDYLDTELERAAQDASRRYSDFGTAAVVTGIGAVAFGVATWLLWPDEEDRLAGAPGNRFQIGLRW